MLGVQDGLLHMSGSWYSPSEGALEFTSTVILQKLRLTSLRDDKAGEQMIRDFKQEKVNVTPTRVLLRPRF